MDNILDGINELDMKAIAEDIKKREIIRKRKEKYDNCKHPFLKHGICDFCGKDVRGE